MLYQGIDDYGTLDYRLAMIPNPPGAGAGGEHVHSRGHSHSTGFPTPSGPYEVSQDSEIDPLVNLYYPMATANPPDPQLAEKHNTSSVLAFSTHSPSSLYDMDFYTSNFTARPDSLSVPSDRHGSVIDNLQAPKKLPINNHQLPANESSHVLQPSQPLDFPSLQTTNPFYRAAGGSLSATTDGGIDNGATDSFKMRATTLPNVNTNLNINSSGSSHARNKDLDDVKEVEDESDPDHSAQLPNHRRVSSSRASSSGGMSSSNGYNHGNKRVSDSRLSAQGLAEVLNLDSAEEALRRERFILDIFERELQYPLGYKTWVRDTSKEYRTQLLDQLHRRVSQTYPEYDKPVLETIIRRATYYMMQSRLRRERRAKAKMVRDEERRNRETGSSEEAKLGLQHYESAAIGPAFMLSEGTYN